MAVGEGARLIFSNRLATCLESQALGSVRREKAFSGGNACEDGGPIPRSEGKGEGEKI